MYQKKNIKDGQVGNAKLDHNSWVSPGLLFNFYI